MNLVGENVLVGMKLSEEAKRLEEEAEKLEEMILDEKRSSEE